MTVVSVIKQATALLKAQQSESYEVLGVHLFCILHCQDKFIERNKERNSQCIVLYACKNRETPTFKHYLFMKKG